MTRHRWRTLAAAAACLGSASLVGAWAAGGNSAVESAAAPAQAAPDFVLRPPPDAASLAETLSRPLFSPDRRPLPAPDAAVDPGADGPPATRLLAVAVGPDRSAAVLQLTSGKTSVLMQGEAIDGWVLVHVAADGVTLKSGQQEVALAIAGGRK